MNKFEQLPTMINGNIDILMISETKIDETYSAAQFSLKGFAIPIPMKTSYYKEILIQK